jgi:8-oxo-dGTP diphosphatase
MKPIDVVAAILRNEQGAILVARRKPGKKLEGYWEFPGGKVEKEEDMPMV